MHWAITYSIRSAELAGTPTAVVTFLSRYLGDGGRCTARDSSIEITIWLDDTCSIAEAALRVHRRIVRGLTGAGETTERARRLANTATVHCHQAQPEGREAVGLHDRCLTRADVSAA